MNAWVLLALLVITGTCVYASDDSFDSDLLEYVSESSFNPLLGSTLEELAKGTLNECKDSSKDKTACYESIIKNEIIPSIDTSVPPCHNFYKYACGNWLKTFKLPEDRSRWSKSFSSIDDNNLKVLHQLITEPTSKIIKNKTDSVETLLATLASSDAQKAKLFFNVCNGGDQDKRTPNQKVASLLDITKNVKDVPSFAAASATLRNRGVGSIIGADVSADLLDPNKNVLSVSQSGLGLPDRVFYFAQDDHHEKIRSKYVAVMKKLHELYGMKDAPVDDILHFETVLALASQNKAFFRNPRAAYNPMTIVEFVKANPNFKEWTNVIMKAHPIITPSTQIVVETPAFFSDTSAMIEIMRPDVMRAYLNWHIILATSAIASDEIAEISFDFFGKTLGGAKKRMIREKRCVIATNNHFWGITGRLYVEHMFPADSKSTAIKMISGIEQEMKVHLSKSSHNTDWLDDSTRAAAIEKLKAVVNKIGFPSVWRTYEDVTMTASYFDNVLIMSQKSIEREFARLSKPVNKTRWEMTPADVNAYYNPSNNEMVFPAGILQPPFFNHKFPVVMNFSGIGMVMGHELSHGFDDQGRRFDAQGRLRSWWKPETAALFKERAECVVDQFDKFKVFDISKDHVSDPSLKMGHDVYVQGGNTVGENLADLGGVALSYDAYNAWAKKNPTLAPETFKYTGGSFTDKQLFFINFAQSWCTKSTMTAELLQVQTDPHSPAEFRVNGPLQNLSIFSDAFNCPADSYMNPSQKCKVW